MKQVPKSRGRRNQKTKTLDSKKQATLNFSVGIEKNDEEKLLTEKATDKATVTSTGLTPVTENVVNADDKPSTVEYGNSVSAHTEANTLKNEQPKDFTESEADRVSQTAQSSDALETYLNPKSSTSGRFQKPKSRSAKILASLNLEKSAEKIAELSNSGGSSVKKVNLTEGVSIIRNIDVQVLRSPAKRKPEENEADSQTSEKNLQSSPSKMSKSSAKKDLFGAVTASLPLPAKFCLLLDKFSALEASVQMLFNRKERCDFEKLTTAVEQVTSRSFSLSDLAKIVTVSPDAYKISWEKKYKCMMTKSFVWSLCLSPKFEDVKDVFVASDIIARKSSFSRNLLDTVHREHIIFLRKLNPKLSIECSQVKRWHPKFPLESIAEVTESELPQKPVIAQPRQGLNELILKTKEKATEKMESALAKIEAMSPKAGKSVTQRAGQSSNFPSSSGISEKLRLKIQAKEAVKAQEQLMMPEDEKEKRALRAKLPEIAKLLRVLFLADKRTAVPENEVLIKCRSGGLSCEQAKTCMLDIEKLCPDWITFVTVQAKTYIKLNKTANFNSVLTKVQIPVGG